MSNVLTEEKKSQIIALGQLGWSLRRIERETGVRRETIGEYLRAAGIGVRVPGAWGRQPPAPAESKPANEVIPNSVAGEEPTRESIPGLNPDSKAANGVIPDSGVDAPEPTITVSASEPYRELIEQALLKGRHAKAIWQDLVDDHGFVGGYQSVKRFIHKLRGAPSPQQPCAVIVTTPGEEALAGSESQGRTCRVDYGQAHGPRSTIGALSPHPSVRTDARLQPQMLAVKYDSSGEVECSPADRVETLLCAPWHWQVTSRRTRMRTLPKTDRKVDR